MKLASIRLPSEMLNELRMLAHIESLRRKQSVTWSGLVREVVQRHLLRPEARGGAAEQFTGSSAS